jgi:enoyl-CoA hydratase/carnithine racemase
VHDVVPRADLPAHVATLAGRLVARSSPAALTTIKRQLYRDWTVALRESARQADVDLDRLVGGPDFRRAVRARANGAYVDFTQGVS